MKKITLFLSAILANLAPCTLDAAGGPDTYGYTWITSLDAGGPAANWIDITGRTGVQTITGLADDNSSAGMINIGFNFHYYWTDQTQLKVGSNGWVSFGNVGNIASCFPTIPTGGGAADNYLAPLMGDLNFSGGGNPGVVNYWTNSVDSFIISYINVPFWSVNSPGYAGSNSFQIILCKSDSSITYQYGALSTFTNNAACVDITVGIENSTGTIGLQPYSDAMPPSNFAIRFEYPNVPLITVADATPLWNNTVDNAGALIVRNAPLTLLSNIRSSGNGNITVPVSLQTNIRDVTSAIVYSVSASIPSMTAGQDSLYAFPAWTPTLAGSYSFETQTTCSQDVNPGNDFNSIELQVVDVCSPTTTLSYVSNTTPTGSLNWNGGTVANSYGAAVYFEPPVYPYTVSSAEYYISSNVSDNFVAAIYDDDGLNGGPGTLLFTTTVPAGSVLTNAWNSVPVTGVVLNSGGFYVTWYQGGTSIFLGTQNSAPYSRRTFEILSASWATWRNSYNQDLFIRAVISNYTTVPVSGFTAAYAGTGWNYQFTDTTVGPVASWAWDFGDGSTSTAQNPAHAFPAMGTYTVCLQSTSPCGSTSSTCVVINACDIPVVTTQAVNSAVCSGASTNFSIAATGDGLTYQWQCDSGSGFVNISGAPYSGETTASLTVATTTTVMNGNKYLCIVSGNCGTATTSTVLLTVNALPAVSLSPISQVCMPASSFSLTNGSPVGGTYSGTGVSGGIFDPSAAGVGTYTLTYTYTDGNNCVNSANTPISVSQTPTVALAALSDVCENTASFALSGGAPSGGTYTGTGVSSNNFDPSAASSGTFTISYSYTDINGCTNSASSSITVNPTPTVTLASFTTVCENTSAFVLTGGSPAGGVYTGTGVSGGSFDPTTAGTGTFTITYTYADNNSCSGIAQANQVVDGCLGVQNLSATAGMSLYPNPATSAINIVVKETTTVEILDMTGKTALLLKISASTSLDISILRSGLYTFRLSSAQGQLLQRVVIE